jgi:hypothetical protein
MYCLPHKLPLDIQTPADCCAGFEHDENTAADLVQCALGRLTHEEEPPTVDCVVEVAAALQEAILEGAVPLTSVVAVGYYEPEQ